MIEKLRRFAFRMFWTAPDNTVREAFWNILHSFLCNPIKEAKTVFNGEMYNYIRYTVKRW